MSMNHSCLCLLCAADLLKETLKKSQVALLFVPVSKINSLKQVLSKVNSLKQVNPQTLLFLCRLSAEDFHFHRQPQDSNGFGIRSNRLDFLRKKRLLNPKSVSFAMR